MTRDQVVEIVEAIANTYHTFKMDDLTKTVNFWFMALGDLDAREAQVSFINHLKTQKFPPTPAEIRAGCKSAGAGIKSPEAAWEDVWKAIHKVSSSEPDSYRREFDKLDAATQRTLGSPWALERLSMMYESDIDKYEKPHFLKDYRDVAASNPAPVDTTPKIEAHFPQIEQKEEERGYTESARQMISNLRMQLGGAG